MQQSDAGDKGLPCAQSDVMNARLGYVTASLTVAIFITAVILNG